MASPQEIVRNAKRHQFKLAGTGLFAQVLWVANSEIAIKIPDERGEAYDIEKQIYQRLGNHRFILRTYCEGESIFGKGLVLQYLPTGTLAANLELEKFPTERAYWPLQSAEAIRYIHSKGVIHCDVSVHNFLIQKDGSIVLADFSGSSLDGSTAIVETSRRYSRPVSAEDTLDQTEKDDIFALGVVIYEIAVGHRLYPEKDDHEVYQLLQKREFPDISGVAELFRTVVEKCWQDQYGSAEEVKSDLESQDHNSNRRWMRKYYMLSFGVLLVLFAIGIQRKIT